MTSPFKFLDSYTKDDREIFFGREREIEELYHRVFESKIMLVYGVSGTGKSSLIHCGLANKFSETDWLPLVIRRGSNILESMATGISSASLTEQQNKFLTPSDFKKGVRSLYLDHYKPIFFLFDQFEELFIFGTKDEKRSFIQIIKAIIESDLQCRFIFVMREEYMAHITEFEKYIHTIFANRVRIEKMSHINALEAIKGPCKAFDISLEEGFAETLVEKLTPGGTEIELTYLQVYLDKIFRLANNINQEGNKLSFTINLLAQTGDVKDVLGSFLDDQTSLLDDPDLAMTFLKAFVSGKGTKRPANEAETIDNVRSLGKVISPEVVTELLQVFVKLRVLRDKDENGRYELRHDALAEKIFEKFSMAEKELLEIRQFIENAYQSFIKRQILLSSDDLNYISNKDSLLNLNEELMGYILESRKHKQSKIRTVRRLTAISALVLILLLGILGYFISNKIEVASANYIAIRSLSQSISSNEKLSLAVIAWQKFEGVLPKEALLTTFNELLNSEIIDTQVFIDKHMYKPDFEPAPEKINWATCSKNNKYIFGYTDSFIIIWESNGKLFKTIESDLKIIDLKMSDDNKYLGAVSTDSILTVFNISGARIFSYKIKYNELNTNQIFKFTTEDNVLALSFQHDAVLLSYDGIVLQTFDKHADRVNAVDISDNNKFIATASSDKTIIIWYLNSIKSKYDYYNTLTWHNDTVWSVSFSSRNKIVISASADSTIKIGSINNEVLSYETFFAKDKKYCHAEFTESDRGVVAQCYDYQNKEPKKIFLALHADNPTCRFSMYYRLMLHGSNGIEFSHFVFSMNENYFVYQQNNKTFIADTRLVFASDNSSISNLMEIGGLKQFFTSDGKFVISIVGNSFVSYFVDIDDILNLLTKRNSLLISR